MVRMRVGARKSSCPTGQVSPQERDNYRERMLAAPTRDECRRMRDEQIRIAAQRANVRGMKYVPDARYDACDETPGRKP